ncbi:MAG: hypothetical protein LQ338_002505 [Usnochroma carphineum]|nr:MAG: hypothetical protein LQ338_002505 [Usnochroma carphineum]
MSSRAAHLSEIEPLLGRRYVYGIVFHIHSCQDSSELAEVLRTQEQAIDDQGIDEYADEGIQEVREGDDELPDPDHELHRLQSQRAPITPSKAKATLANPTVLPTPVATPRQGTSTLNSTPKPSNGIGHPVHLTPSTTPAQIRKRAYIEESSDSDPIPMPSKRSRLQDHDSPSENRARRVPSTFRVPLTITPQSTPGSKIGPGKRIRISSFEIRRVKESIMEQMDWDQVAYDVACNRRAGVYKRAVKEVLDGWLEEVIVREEKN